MKRKGIGTATETAMPGSEVLTLNESGPTVSFFTLGCKLNQAETDGLAREFQKRGYRIRPFRESVDLTVINTCTVTNQADAKDRNIIRQAVQASPHGKVAVVGCYSQVKPDEVASIEGVHIILGSKEKFRIFEHLQEHSSSLPGPLIIRDSEENRASYPETDFETSTGRTRAFLKIQDGCSYNCSYCIIPEARGKGSSRSFESIRRDIIGLSEKGYREIVLTGVNIGTYRYNGKTLLDILKLIGSIDPEMRVRISSIEVNLLSDSILDYAVSAQHVLPHFHLPLQSGSDTILDGMLRKYRTELFRRRVEAVRSRFPNAAIGSDIITGFPGETDELHAESVNFIKEMRFSYLHVFRFSERSGTKAAAMSDKVDERVKKARAAELKELGERSKALYLRTFPGTVDRVLWERREEGVLSGLSDHYMRVEVPWPDDSLLNTCSSVRINEVRGNILKGAIV